MGVDHARCLKRMPCHERILREVEADEQSVVRVVGARRKAADIAGVADELPVADLEAALIHSRIDLLSADEPGHLRILEVTDVRIPQFYAAQRHEATWSSKCR